MASSTFGSDDDVVPDFLVCPIEVAWLYISYDGRDPGRWWLDRVNQWCRFLNPQLNLRFFLLPPPGLIRQLLLVGPKPARLLHCLLFLSLCFYSHIPCHFLP